MKFVTEYIPMTGQEALVSAMNAFDAGSKIRIMRANGKEYVDMWLNFEAQTNDQLFMAEAVCELGSTPMEFDYDAFQGFLKFMVSQNGYMVTRKLPKIYTVLAQYGAHQKQQVL